MKKWLAAFFLFLLVLDGLSKWGAAQWLAPLSGHSFYPFGGLGVFEMGGFSFSLNFVTNTGAAWGVFAGYSGLLFFFRTLIIFSLILYLLFFNQGKNPEFPLWLIVTGAIGNAIDYCVYGHVIDFFHFHFWGASFPLFNFADAYITLGAVGLFFSTQFTRRAQQLP